MAMFDSLKDTLNRGVATVSVKSETLVESSRVKTMISNTKRILENEKASFGAQFYQNWREGKASVELFEADLTRIQGLEQEIIDLNARLLQIKAEEDRFLSNIQTMPEGMIYCSHCGKMLPVGSRFCDECGSPVT